MKHYKSIDEAEIRSGNGRSRAGSWEMPELCRIMGNARSCAGSWEIAE